ncbi:MAG: undecaprenyl-phosphate glucose phosphotransferase [Candidatus Omnitrophota bacterium]
MIIPRRRKRDTFLPLVQFGVDCATIYAALGLVFWARFASGRYPSELGAADYPVYYRSFHLIFLVLAFFLRFYGLYKPARFLTFSAETVKVVRAVLMSTLVLMALSFFLRGFSYSRTYLVLSGVALAFAVSAARFLLGLFVMAVDEKRHSWRNILVIGADENAVKLVKFYEKHRRFGSRVIGFLDDKLPEATLCEGVPVVGKIGELGRYLETHREAHEVVLAAQGLPTETVLKIIYECEKLLVAFRWIADMFGLIASKMSVSYVSGVPLLSFVDSPLGDWENRFLKRLMDVSFSGTALLFLSPVLAVVACLVKMSSPGPIFYKQERVGEDGRRFLLYKFRTMPVGSEKSTGPVWAVEGDLRRTRVGAFLRKNNLDELPQIWNVLRGDMSLVGPRPERPFFVSQFKEDIPRYMARHTIRSGITGWAQVNGLRGNTSIEERTKFDLFYIENWSLFLDLKILFLTSTTFFRSRNAY